MLMDNIYRKKQTIFILSLLVILLILFAHLNITLNNWNFFNVLSNFSSYDLKILPRLECNRTTYLNEINNSPTYDENYNDSWTEYIPGNMTPPYIKNATVLHNFVRARLRILGNKSITLCTQGTYQYFHHIEELCMRWNGPISVSVFAPGYDLQEAVKGIKKLRICSKASACIVNMVSWHLVYPTHFGPKETPIFIEDTNFNCSVLINSTSFQVTKNLPYPINVCRNVARRNARTYYVCVSDIELYPSEDIIPRFLAMPKLPSPTVYTLAIFEVSKEYGVPRNKSELVNLFKKSIVIYFHKHICPACQYFPNKERWVKPTNNSESCLSILTVVKRQKHFKHWEPIYIGTAKEPEYLMKLSWDGKQDKMGQAYEMCLMNYNFAVLNDVFICHSPGIKRSSGGSAKRQRYAYPNHLAGAHARKEILRKHGASPGCN